MAKNRCNPGPRNLRNAENYSVGLDLGTGSVGWAVVDENGELYRVNGNKPTWGSRLFPSAETAANTRKKRGQRRRYERRRQRIDTLQQVFCEEMSKVDPAFFIRMRQSRLFKDDRDPQFETDYDHPFFNGTDFTESDYYATYPTIWHLRKHLMETARTGEKADLRLIYLALHNIVKYRGNFLHENEGRELTAAHANALQAATDLVETLQDYLADLDEDSDSYGTECAPDIAAIEAALDKPGIKRQERVEKLEEALHFSAGRTVIGKVIAKACIGYKANYMGNTGLFDGAEEKEKTSFSFSDDESKIEEFRDCICPEEGLELFEALQRAYSSYVLANIIGKHGSLSAAMVASYNQHKADLEAVKKLTKNYLGLIEYRALFRGPKIRNPLNPNDPTPRYDYNKIPRNSYTSYVVRRAKGKGETGAHHCSQEELVKTIREKFESCPELCADPLYARIEPRLKADDGKFLAKQKTRDNGAIPYQLHLEEMTAIIKAQGAHYPFLLENQELLEKLVSSRIPYYVGPLNTQRDPKGSYPNPIDRTRKFAWSVRREGTEGVKAYPWNVDEVIDTDETAGRFIRRMTGACAYLYGEDVLPRCSLLYEEFCVLNELNGARWAPNDREDSHRFDTADREAIVEEVFKGRKGVSHRAIADWLTKNHGVPNPSITGTQAEKGFESKLGSYRDFCEILGVNRLEEAPLSFDQIEEIILWNTVFEDRDILRRKLVQKYGAILTEDQIAKIVHKRYKGWGRLSRKFLTGLKVETSRGPLSIMDVLRRGNPYSNRYPSLNLMETLRDKKLGFQDLVDRTNHEYLEGHNLQLGIDDLQGSPALRRTVNQAMRVLDELVSITGKPPACICIEETRDDDEKKKGKRTKTRYKQLKEAVDALKKDTEDFDKELAIELAEKQKELDDDRLMLYFAQAGKCLYSGEKLDINNLQSYQIDHILPQSYIKDDSLDNRALVIARQNQRKLDSMLLDNEIIRHMRTYWEELKRCGLMSDRKFARLTRTHIGDEQLKGFINRQIVETSQIVKFTRQLCEQRFPDTKIITIRASLSHGLRENCGFVKCRELNNYHHAHDAYLACQMARFIEYRYPSWSDGFDLAMVRQYIKRLAQESGRSFRTPGRSGFIVDSFMKSGFNKETGEIFKDTWDAERTIARMRADLNSNYCFISRMPEEKSGAFWDETVYSPRDATDGKNLGMPLKQSGAKGGEPLDPKRYGGPNNVKQAYFFVFAAKDKKGRTKFFFEGVPIYLVERIKQDKTGTALRAYAEQIANQSGCSGAVVLRDKVLNGQVVQINDSKLVLKGKSNSKNEVRPAVELSFDMESIKLAVGYDDEHREVSCEKKEALFDELVVKLGRTCPKLADQLKLSTYRQDVAALDTSEWRKVMFGLTAIASGTKPIVDLKSVGGTGQAGHMFITVPSSIQSITWIDQSVTGIFERRTTFEDLTRGL